jgi:hypothetical protein
MGTCFAENKKRSNSKVLNPNAEFHKNKNPNSIISDKTNATVIKTIKQINGDAICIENNNSSIIMILDYSSSVSIQKCNDCSIFIAPCSNSIIIRDCENLNVISASQQLRLTNVNNSNLFVFCSTSPAIESSSNVRIGMFYIQYMELVEMISKAKLNIWENQWSEFNKFGSDVSVTYANDSIKEEVSAKFQNGFSECYMSTDSYQFIPFIYGKSIHISPNMSNIVLVFKEEDCIDSEILKHVQPDELNNRACKLIKTIIMKDDAKNNNYNELKRKIVSGSNQGLIEYFNKKDGNAVKSNRTNNNYDGTQKSNKLNSLDVTGGHNDEYIGEMNMKYLNKKELLFIWLSCENFGLEEMQIYTESVFGVGHFGWITKEQIGCSERDYLALLKSLFELN